jgi:hypothetical protein
MENTYLTEKQIVKKRRLTSGLLQAGLISRDKYAENQMLARVENSLETPPAASRHHVGRKHFGCHVPI